LVAFSQDLGIEDAKESILDKSMKDQLIFVAFASIATFWEKIFKNI